MGKIGRGKKILWKRRQQANVRSGVACAHLRVRTTRKSSYESGCDTWAQVSVTHTEAQCARGEQDSACGFYATLLMSQVWRDGDYKIGVIKMVHIVLGKLRDSQKCDIALQIWSWNDGFGLALSSFFFLCFFGWGGTAATKEWYATTARTDLPFLVAFLI